MWGRLLAGMKYILRNREDMMRKIKIGKTKKRGFAKKVLALTLGAAMAFSGVGCLDDEDDDPIEDTGSGSQGGSSQSEQGKYSGDNSKFTTNGTKISTDSGSLKIDRVSRSEEVSMGKDNWTIFVYLCGSNLESDDGAGTADFDEMMEASFGDDVTVIVETGGANSWQNGVDEDAIQRYKVTSGDMELVDEQKKSDMGKPETFTSFLEWGVKNYPAEHMGVVFWNHGSGSINGVCFDENYNDNSLSLKEFESSFKSVYGSMTDRFEFVGFDACLMSTLETANVLVPYARYMYASQETEPGSGWNYTEILDYLGKNPDADGASLGKVVLDSYVNSCTYAEDKAIVTFSIVNLSKIDAVMEAFNDVSKEIYNSSSFDKAIKAIKNADNFGGNNKSEGYTNMIDLGTMASNVSSYASSASKLTSALKEAVIYNKNGKSHSGAGGLSIYYPLSVEGSNEIKIFADVCVSPWYYNVINKVVYGIETGSTDSYSSSTNESVAENSDDIWEEDYEYTDVSTNEGEYQTLSDSSSLNLADAYISDEGNFVVELEDIDKLYTACASIFLEEDDEVIYIGSIEDVNFEGNSIIDNFDGLWPTLGDALLPLELVDAQDDYSIYTCEILLNGEQTNLRVSIDWSTSKWEVLGTFDGIDEETGMSNRNTYHLKDGDVIEPIYYVTSGDDWEAFTMDDCKYTVKGTPEIEFGYLFEGTYEYSFDLYDIYGNTYYSPTAIFEINEDGEILYDEDIYE